MKIGTLIHTLFLLFGDGEEMGGFHSTMSGVLQILSHEIVWDVEIGELLMKAILKLSEEERKRLGAALLEDLQKPVGKLGRNKWKA